MNEVDLKTIRENTGLDKPLSGTPLSSAQRAVIKRNIADLTARVNELEEQLLACSRSWLELHRREVLEKSLFLLKKHEGKKVRIRYHEQDRNRLGYDETLADFVSLALRGRGADMVSASPQQSPLIGLSRAAFKDAYGVVAGKQYFADAQWAWLLPLIDPKFEMGEDVLNVITLSQLLFNYEGRITLALGSGSTEKLKSILFEDLLYSYDIGAMDAYGANCTKDWAVVISGKTLLKNNGGWDGSFYIDPLIKYFISE